MKKTHLHITIILLILFSYNSYSQNEEINNIQSNKNIKIDTVIKYRTDGTKEFEVKTKNGLKTGYGFFFDRNDNIIGLKYYAKDTLNGYNLLHEKTFRPKYLYESNNGKPKGILIQFHNNGSIKKFRSADIFNESQILKFHENGVIKEIGQTKKGKSHGTFLYFDENGKLEKKVEYEYGNILK